MGPTLQAHLPPRHWGEHGMDRLREAVNRWHSCMCRDGSTVLCIAAWWQASVAKGLCTAYSKGLRTRLAVLPALSWRQNTCWLQGLDGLDGRSGWLPGIFVEVSVATEAIRPLVHWLPLTCTVPAVWAWFDA